MNPDSITEENAPEQTRPEIEHICLVLEGALLAAGRALGLSELAGLFEPEGQPSPGRLREALALLDTRLADRAVELREVAGGFRLQVRSSLAPAISLLWQEKTPRYSRALLETLAIIAYRQPITRGEIEQIRGVSLSSNILKTLQERDWIRTVGHRDLPGKPELLGTTRDFLDYFGLRGLDDLPTLAEIRDLDNPAPQLALNDPDSSPTESTDQSDEAQADRTQETADEPPEDGEQGDIERPRQEAHIEALDPENAAQRPEPDDRQAKDPQRASDFS